MRRGQKPSKDKVEARPPVARKSPKNDGARVRDLEKRLAEALQREAEGLEREAEAQDQQMATAEILQVISSSPTDIRPVLETVAEHASRVCGADDAVIYRVDGNTLRRVAHHGSIPLTAPTERSLPDPGSVTGRAVLDRRTVHIPDIEETANEFSMARTFARQHGLRTHLAAPLLCGGSAIGVILIRRLNVRPFTPKQIALLQTFADQAVIAIENVRLFNETKEALTGIDRGERRMRRWPGWKRTSSRARRG